MIVDQIRKILGSQVRDLKFPKPFLKTLPTEHRVLRERPGVVVTGAEKHPERNRRYRAEPPAQEEAGGGGTAAGLG